MLSRDSNSSVTYLYDNNGNVNDVSDDIPLATSDNFNDDADTGYRLSGSKKLSSKWSINAGLMSSEMSYSETITEPAGQLTVFPLNNTDQFDAADSVKTSYDSDLSSEEINAVYNFNDKIDFIIGLGHLSLDEKFRITSDDTTAAGIGTYTINTGNDMTGFHAGIAISHKATDKVGLYFVGKIGWYDNDTDQKQRVDDTSLPLRVNSGSDNESSTVYDIQLGASYDINKQLAVRLSYQLISISNVALASSQFDVTSTGTNAVNGDNDIDWDGFNLGVRYTF
jgi:opacity protein-like surface antigen